MPVKFLGICKPRNTRTVILALILLTVVFAAYQLLYGRVSQILPTALIPVDSNVVAHQGVVRLENSQPDLQAIDGLRTASSARPVQNEGSYGEFVPRFDTGFKGSNYDAERDRARCPRMQMFKPDIDTTELYPTLEFNADWIRTKEYWNPQFEQRYKSAKKEANELKVFVIPHSHNDPGWLKTFEGYFTSQTKHIIDNAVEKLTEFKNMTFQWSEISFLSKWWKEAHPRKRRMLQNLVNEGRLEIVTGAWTMTDEAVTPLYALIDQLIEGQQWVKSHLNVTPKASWSVDPFGHGSAFPYILNLAGIKGMVIQRIHYGWKKFFMVNRASDFQWVQRWDFFKRHAINCHNQPFDIYSIKHSCGPHPQICLNFDFRSIKGEYAENSLAMQPITDANVQQKAELMLEQYGKTASLFPHNMALISLGDDFRFQHEIEWDQQYNNYMKLFEFINSNKERYKTSVQFSTLSEYFKALEEQGYHFPTLSGDFHVYSDIFSDGRPAYWSGYYGTRPYWKKFYRETENSVRGAEILYTFAYNLASQKNLNQTRMILTRNYEDLTTARRWLALFAHHDAVTGTSKAHTMKDYGEKLLDALQLSQKIQMGSIETILFGNAEEGKLVTGSEIEDFGEQPRQIPLTFDTPSGVKKIVLYNSIGRHRYQPVTVVVTTPYVEVVGPNGEYLQAQLNPVLEGESNLLKLSSDVFELSFLAYLRPFSVSVYQVQKSTPDREHNAVRALVYCKNCKSSAGLFEINEIQKGDIQLNNDRLQVLLNRDTGMLMGITKSLEGVTTSVDMKFGSYSSVFFRSGAYLLKPDIQTEQPIPFPNISPKLIILSGPISSELSVIHDPLVLSTRLMHAGDSSILEAVYVQNLVDLGSHSGEVFMRFDTDLKSDTKPKTLEKSAPTNQIEEDPIPQPTFYTDQSGFTVEKRVKVPEIGYEGNTYPVNTMAFIQDENRKLRFSVLVDRSHGFSSMEVGRLETLIERRTVYDDGRGMGEGVTDNRPTISRYIILFEKLLPEEKVRHSENNYRHFQPTLAAYHHSQDLSYPGFAFFLNESIVSSLQHSRNPTKSVDIFPLISPKLPCDTHLINLRTLTDSTVNPDLNFPSNTALMIVQRLGYLCNSVDEKPGCCNPNPSSFFYPQTSFNGLNISKIIPSNIVGETQDNDSIPNFHSLVGDPFEIKSALVKFG